MERGNIVIPQIQKIQICELEEVNTEQTKLHISRSKFRWNRLERYKMFTQKGVKSVNGYHI